jgi:hypothetical protein
MENVATARSVRTEKKWWVKANDWIETFSDYIMGPLCLYSSYLVGRFSVGTRDWQWLAMSVFMGLISAFFFFLGYDKLVGRIYLSWLQSRHQRLWRRVLVRRISGNPYRTTSSIQSSDLVRWRIEHTPDHSEDIRCLAALEARITSLETSLRPEPTDNPAVKRT